MAVYTAVDLASNFSGDLCLSDNGDIAIANSIDTYKAAANFVLRTDYGDYAPNENVGSNLGNYIGENNTPEIHEKMEVGVKQALINELFDKTDVSVDAVPLDVNEALVVINLAGYFLVDNELTYLQDEKINYTFPYIEGDISPIIIND